MSNWPTGITVGPIGTWPGPLTPSSRREVSKFKTADAGGGLRRVSTPWATTLADLSRELRAIGAKDHELLLAVAPQDFRLDGLPRATAKAEHPGVILSFDMPGVGRVSYPCDNFTDWQSNVRAVALGLEALRKFDRYKIGTRHQQYRGYLAIEAGTAMPSSFASPEDAIDFLLGFSESTKLGTEDGALKRVLRQAQRKVHPDLGGSAADAQRVSIAEKLLREKGYI